MGVWEREGATRKCYSWFRSIHLQAYIGGQLEHSNPPLQSYYNVATRPHEGSLSLGHSQSVELGALAFRFKIGVADNLAQMTC
jgi:hypothetical protein